MTTLINTHDMNSVMGIGEKIIYIYEGHKEWEGNKDDILSLIHIFWQCLWRSRVIRKIWNSTSWIAVRGI